MTEQIPWIVSSIISIITPLVSKGAEKIVEKGAEETYGKRAEIWDKVKGFFPPKELTTLKLFEKAPKSLENQEMFRNKLEYLINENPKASKELYKLIKEFLVIEKQNTSTIRGDNNFIIQQVSKSKIKIKNN